MTERGLQRLLQATASATVYPETPDLRGAVLARLEPTRGTGARRWVLSPLALAFVLLLALATVLLLPPSREAIARFFGVQGSRIEWLPVPLDGTTASPFPRPESIDTSAIPLTLSELRGRTGGEAVLPAVSDELVQAYLARYGDRPVVILHYERFDLWQTQLGVFGTFAKQVPQTGTVRDVLVGAHNGRWLTGEHLVYYEDRGVFIQGSQRTVTRNTLIWRTPRSFYRLETDLPLEEALQVARTLP